jgi:hypothetical protein
MNLVIQHPALSRTVLDSIATELGAPALANSPFAARFAAPAGFDRAALDSLSADYRLIAFDMDSTLISIECIDEIADFAGRKAEVAEPSPKPRCAARSPTTRTACAAAWRCWPA